VPYALNRNGERLMAIKSGSGRGKKESHAASRKGGKTGGKK
jgi:hypothetical protein